MADQIDLNAPIQQAKQNTTDLTGLFNQQRQGNTDFLKSYTGAIQGQPSMSALADQIGGQLNLPQLRANAQGYQNTLFSLPQTYKDATMGSDTNANQLARLVGQKQSELGPSAELAQQNLGNAENTLNARLGYAQTDQARALLPYQSQQQLMSDQNARETTGFTQTHQAELDSIIAKMNAGITLSEGEAQRANQLAIAEAGYQNELDKVKLQGQQPQNVGYGGIYLPSQGSILQADYLKNSKYGYVDPNTGQTIGTPAGGNSAAANISSYLPQTSQYQSYLTPPSYFQQSK